MTASEQIDEIIAGLTDWRGAVFARIRKIIHEADPVITEEIKWRGAPVWSHDGNICVGGAFKDKVKLTFPEGATLPDPDKLFNNGLAGKDWRAMPAPSQPPNTALQSEPTRNGTSLMGSSH